MEEKKMRLVAEAKLKEAVARGKGVTRALRACC